MAAEEAAEESDAAADLRALERDVGGLALDEAGDGEDDDAGSLGSVDDEETPADATLSLQMVCAKNLPPDSLRDEAEDAESLASAVERLEHVRLDRCGLVSLLPLPGDGGGDPASTASQSSAGPDSVNATTARALSISSLSPLLLGSLRNVSSLYLQKNRLVSLGGAVCAETTPKLRFLALSDNALNDTIRDDESKQHPLRGLETLTRLMYLDCSGNANLESVASLLSTLPSSIAFCDFSHCALSVSSSYRPALIASFDALKQIDGVPVTRLERREARALLGDEGEDGDEEESEESDGDGDGDGDDFGEDFGDRKTPHGFVLEKTPSNPSAAAAAAAALAMTDDTLAFDETLEPTTEAELASELAELERETRAVRAALDANDGDVFFFVAGRFRRVAPPGASFGEGPSRQPRSRAAGGDQRRAGGRGGARAARQEALFASGVRGRGRRRRCGGGDAERRRRDETMTRRRFCNLRS
jgi:hypothetical protein